MYYEYYESITNFMVVIINYILIFSFLSDHTRMNSQDSTHVDRQHINPEKHNFNVLESLPSIVLGDNSKIVAPLTNEHQDTPVPSNSVFYENTTTIPSIEKLFHKGQLFTSFKSILKILLPYTRQIKPCISMSHSITIKDKMKNSQKLTRIYCFIKFLQYYTVTYSCEFGESRANKRDSTLLSNEDSLRTTFSKKLGCPFKLKFTYQNRKLKLEEMIEHNGHSNLTFKKMRPEESLYKTIDLLGDEKINLRRIMNLIPEQNLNNNSYADIYKIRRQKIDKIQDEKDEKFLLYSFLGVFEEFYVGDELYGIYYQDDHMKRLYRQYSETLYFDGTYNLFYKGFTLFILNIVNGEGKTEPVVIFSSLDECYESMIMFLYKFQEDNDCSFPKLCLTDKDWVERKIIKEIFPNCEMRLCVFHVIKAITTKINTLLRAQSKKAKEIEKKKLYNIIFASSESMFDEAVNKLQDTVKDYFNKNWNKHKTEFVTYFYSNKINFDSRTNNRAESMNSVLKAYFKGKRNPRQFFVELKSYLDRFRKERYSLTIRKYLKREKTKRVLPIVTKLKKDFSIYACKLLTTRICNEWRKESECNLLLKFGIVCEKCIIKNELSWDQAYNLIHDRWNKRHIIGMINFEELEITKEEFMTHQNIVNGSTLTCADNEREVYVSFCFKMGPF